MSKIPNVLFIFHDSNLYSGATRSLIDIIENLTEKKLIAANVLFNTSKGSALAYFKDLRIDIFYYKFYSAYISLEERKTKKWLLLIPRIIRHIFSVINIYQLKNIILEKRIDLIYTNTSSVLVGAYISNYYKIPHIWHLREFGKEDHRLVFFMGDSLFYKLANRSNTQIIVISDALKEKYKKQITEVPIKVIYNDLSKKFDNPKIKFNHNQILSILVAGRIGQGKNQLSVIKAVKNLIDQNIHVNLHFAGDVTGSYYYELLDYINENNLQNFIVFHGLVQKMNELRSTIDIEIIASQSEAFGRVTIEGMLSSNLIIGFDRGATSELIRNGETGFLYQKEEQLAQIIKTLCNDRNLLENVAKNGHIFAKKFIKGDFSIEIYNLIVNSNGNILMEDKR